MANYTQHYQLHQWEPNDNFLRTDFNTDFEKIDTALDALQTAVEGKCQVVSGSYTGDGTENRSFDLGFAPSALLLETSTGARGNGINAIAGLALPGLSVHDGAIGLTETGFSLNHDNKYHAVNGVGETFYYLAFQQK